MVLPNSEGIPPVPTYSGYCYVYITYSYGTLTLCGWLFHAIQIKIYSKKQSYNPDVAVTTSVWANPRSLATTCGITVVFFSWGYLDVSVLPVRSTHCVVMVLQTTGLPHSEIYGLMDMCSSP
jgi:hypothetical protein